MCLVLRLDRRGRGQCAAAAKRSEGSARGGGMLRGSTSKSRNPVIADEPPSSIAQKTSFSLRFIFYSDLLTKLSASFLDSLFIFATVAPQRSSNDVVLVQYAQTAAAWNNSRTVWAP